MRLSPSAQGALDTVHVKQAALKAARALFEEELKLELEKKLEPFVNDRNLAVKMADESGVPRTQIGRALGTSNYKTIQEILEQFGITPRTQSEAIPTKPWSCHQTASGWRLSITNLGVGSVTGSAIVALEDDDLVWVSGDEFVLPQIYRNGLAEEVKQCITES